MVFDLDPGEGTTVVECCRVALLIQDLLDERDNETRVKTSGSKGLQVYTPLRGRPTWEKSRAKALEIAQTLEQAHPDLVTSIMRKVLRRDKVLIDWSQNHPAKTTVGAYSVRAQSQPMVSTPISWKEVRNCLKTGDPATLKFTCDEVVTRVERMGDLFAL
jgi:bifunctional non-homologous end joining protein LigD